MSLKHDCYLLVKMWKYYHLVFYNKNERKSIKSKQYLSLECGTVAQVRSCLESIIYNKEGMTIKPAKHLETTLEIKLLKGMNKIGCIENHEGKLNGAAVLTIGKTSESRPDKVYIPEADVTITSKPDYGFFEIKIYEGEEITRSSLLLSENRLSSTSGVIEYLRKEFNKRPVKYILDNLYLQRENMQLKKDNEILTRKMRSLKRSMGRFKRMIRNT
ncbi:hypothetical protein [Saccharicrinis sp. GN24d3]|uniref:hypothetical protein n=1 Tax=Saccharicrinis sp. GN24d3 TaxID=3458416 RepID=UPI0040367C74